MLAARGSRDSARVGHMNNRIEEIMPPGKNKNPNYNQLWLHDPCPTTPPHLALMNAADSLQPCCFGWNNLSAKSCFSGNKRGHRAATGFIAVMLPSRRTNGPPNRSDTYPMSCEHRNCEYLEEVYSSLSGRQLQSKQHVTTGVRE